jgi:cell division septation protein DedD
MDPALKQRLVGAAVLVGLAVIFLPMLVQGPAPDSGVADLPLSMPPAPQAGFETRDLPLVGPPAGTTEGVATGTSPDAPATATPSVQSDTLPQVDAIPPEPEAPDTPASTQAPQRVDVPPAAAATTMFPAATAGGDYAVSWGSFATVASADASVASLRASQLPAYREAATVDGKSVQRVRIGPYASRADAEAARLRAAHVRDDMDAKVITLDGATAAPKPAATAPRPAAADTGFAVQVAAFSSQADADELVARARAAGFSAFTETVSIGASKLVRVRVGPVSTRAEADRLQAQVKAKLGIDGLVRPHP